MQGFIGFLVLILSFFQPSWVLAEVAISGMVQQVLSGDQLMIVHADMGIQPIRLAQIDAPELAVGACKAQPWAEIAQKALSQKVQGASVQALCADRLDSEGFALCQLLEGGDNINQWMLAQGHAWLDRSQGGAIWLQQLEQEAKRKRLGLWGNAAAVIPPWQYKTQCVGNRR